MQPERKEQLRIAWEKEKATPPKFFIDMMSHDIGHHVKTLKQEDCRWAVVKSGDDYLVARIPHHMRRNEVLYDSFEQAARSLVDCYADDLIQLEKEIAPLRSRARQLESKLATYVNTGSNSV